MWFRMRRQVLLRMIVMLTQLPVSVYDKSGTELEKYEITPRKMNPYECMLAQELIRRLQNEEFAAAEYDGTLPVKMYGLKGMECDYLLGPFAYGSLDTDTIRNHMRRHKLEEFPQVQLRDSLLAANLIWNACEDGADEFGIDLLEGGLKEDEDDRMHFLIEEELRQNDAFQCNHTQADENVLYQYVERGDVEYLKKNYDLLYLQHPVILDDICKNEEYMAVIGISLASRAAIRGGLTSKEGFLVNDIYLKRLAACKSVGEIYHLVKEAHVYCASQVRNKKRTGNTNPYVERCKKLIIAKRLEPIELETLAAEAGISKEYLSKLFKQYEGIPVTEYILNIKMEAACDMLRYSDRKVREIADYLNFGSLSYFSRIFKKKTGKSPQQFRKDLGNSIV